MNNYSSFTLNTVKLFLFAKQFISYSLPAESISSLPGDNPFSAAVTAKQNSVKIKTVLSAIQAT